MEVDGDNVLGIMPMTMIVSAYESFGVLTSRYQNSAVQQ